ncbi:MAG: VOC family protein [Phycisphaerae bacterium]|nr:VOC family protein [Saprospiraceae bacterium]
MTTPFLGLRTCIYRVPDVAAAAEWYSNALGIKPYFNEPFYVGFNVGGYELGLHPEGPASAKATAGKGDNIETYWGVEEIQATFAHLIAAGATAHEQPNNVGEDLWVAMVKDPWGNIIGIIQNPHFKIQ